MIDFPHTAFSIDIKDSTGVVVHTIANGPGELRVWQDGTRIRLVFGPGAPGEPGYLLLEMVGTFTVGDTPPLPAAILASRRVGGKLRTFGSQRHSVDRQITEQEELLSEALKEAQALQDEHQTRTDAWAELWSTAPFEPLDPDAMLEWLATRGEALDSVERHAAAERRVTALRREETEARQRILAEMGVVAATDGQPSPCAYLRATTPVMRRLSRPGRPMLWPSEGTWRAGSSQRPE